MVGPWFRVPAEKVFFYFFGHLLICLFVIFLPFPFFFTCWLVSVLFILLSRHSFGSCCNKHISSYLLFVHMLTAGFFFSKGPRGFDGFRGMKGSKV